jgi:hypothetical protein
MGGGELDYDNDEDDDAEMRMIWYKRNKGWINSFGWVALLMGCMQHKVVVIDCLCLVSCLGGTQHLARVPLLLFCCEG